MGWLFAALAGVAVPLTLAPFQLWPLGVLAVALHLLVLERAKDSRQAALLGFVFGLGKYGFGASWIYVSIHVYGHAPPWLAVTLVGLFVSFLALFNGGMAWLWFRFFAGVASAAEERRQYWAPALAFAALWTLLDWFWNWFLTGFPWLQLGYGHLTTPLGGYAPVGGVLLVTFFVALSGVIVARVRWAGMRLAQCATLVLVIWSVGAVLHSVAWVQAQREIDVALVQGNIPQSTKWDPSTVTRTLQTYVDLTSEHWGKDLVVWPEAAITIFLEEAQPFLAQLDQKLEGAGGSLVTGIVSWRPQAGIRNMAIAVGEGEGEYEKRRLVPFGEYVPLESWLRGSIEFFDLPMSHTQPGHEDQPLLRAGDLQIAMAICYEIVYPDLVRVTGRNADVLITISNDTWFGQSIGPLQHMQMAQMRALEMGRYLIRATNDGVTGIIDERGNLRAKLPQFAAGTLVGKAKVMVGQTPFAALGSWPVLVAAASLLLFAGISSRRVGASVPNPSSARDVR